MLQAIALYKAIEKSGHEIYIIDYHNPRVTKVERPSFRGKSLKGAIVYGLLYRHYLKKKFATLHEEIRSLCAHSQPTTPGNVDRLEPLFDRFIVGSDQVWALDVTDSDYHYFLDFIKDDSKKYAFASSISNEKIFADDENAGKLVDKFAAVAVRELEARQCIEEKTGRRVDWVCDPTLLLTANEWDNLIEPVAPNDDNYVVIYFKDNNNKIFKDALEYGRRNRCKVLFVGNALKWKGIESVYPKSLGEFTGLIKNAKAVFTASYHGMLFALYYQRQLVYYNRNQKSRMQTISDMLSIGANDGEQIANGSIPPIDYEDVDKRLGDFRAKSAAILANMLI